MIDYRNQVQNYISETLYSCNTYFRPTIADNVYAVGTIVYVVSKVVFDLAIAKSLKTLKNAKEGLISLGSIAGDFSLKALTCQEIEKLGLYAIEKTKIAVEALNGFTKTQSAYFAQSAYKALEDAKESLNKFLSAVNASIYGEKLENFGLLILEKLDPAISALKTFAKSPAACVVAGVGFSVATYFAISAITTFLVVSTSALVGGFTYSVAKNGFSTTVSDCKSYIKEFSADENSSFSSVARNIEGSFETLASASQKINSVKASIGSGLGFVASSLSGLIGYNFRQAAENAQQVAETAAQSVISDAAVVAPKDNFYGKYIYGAMTATATYATLSYTLPIVVFGISLVSGYKAYSFCKEIQKEYLVASTDQDAIKITMS
jgi:hypothetical protein